MKKLILAISILGLVACGSDDSSPVETNKCECLKQEYKVTMSSLQTDVVSVGEPYRTCEISTNGEVKPYYSYTRPKAGEPQITIDAYKVECIK